MTKYQIITPAPLNKFLKIYDQIRADMSKYGNTDEKYWPFTYEHDCKKGEYEPFGEFFHKLKTKVNDHTCIFFWQTYPVYRQGTRTETENHLLNDSETRKDLYKWMNFTFSLVRIGRNYMFPNEYVWGMKLNKQKFAVFYTGRSNNKEEMVFSCTKKSELKRWWESVAKSHDQIHPIEL